MSKCLVQEAGITAVFYGRARIQGSTGCWTLRLSLWIIIEISRILNFKLNHTLCASLKTANYFDDQLVVVIESKNILVHN